MRDAVKFFLDRMETNPDEFLQDSINGVKHNWLSEINSHKKYFSTEEHEAVFSKLATINLSKLKERIALRLLKAEQQEEEELSKQSLVDAVRKMQIEQDAKQLLVRQELLDAMRQYKER